MSPLRNVKSGIFNRNVKYGATTKTLIYGSMYVLLADGFIVSIGDANPTEVASADSFVAGQLNIITFDDHHLDVKTAGVYEILWSMSAHTDLGGNTEIHAGVMVDGVAIRDNGEAHRTVANTNDTGASCGVALMSLPNGNEEISLWVSNDLSNDVHINHCNVTIKQVA